MAHTFDPANADRLEDPSRYRYCSRDELLGLLDPDEGDRVLDLGSGTGFYTDEVAPFAGAVYALDLQPEMHALYEAKGVPGNVALLTAHAEALPLGDATLDAAYTTMTFHEIATSTAAAECARVLAPGGRFVAVDWSAEGRGEGGPPRSERESAASARSLLEDAGFEVVHAEERPETFALVARAGANAPRD